MAQLDKPKRKLPFKPKDEIDFDDKEEITEIVNNNEIAKDSLFSDINFGELLSDLLSNEELTDITIKRGGEVWISGLHVPNGHAKLVLTDKYSAKQIAEFKDLITKIPNQLAIKMGVMFNAGTPSLDAESNYKGKSQLRFNAIDGSLTDDGNVAIAIRLNTYKMRVTKENILHDNYATPEFLEVMKCLIDAGCNTVAIGLTGSGKTESIKYFARHIRTNESIITIEDTLEAYLKRHYPNKDVLSLKSRDQYDYSYLLRDCLRQNPDWICISEARGEEIKGLLEAVGTGHRILTTIHGDNPANLPNRMIDMAKVDGQEATRMYRQIHNNIDICFYIHYYNDEEGAHRRITEASEFYIDKDGKQKQHTFFRLNYETGEYIMEKLQSNRIYTKLARAKTNTEKIKGIFV